MWPPKEKICMLFQMMLMTSLYSNVEIDIMGKNLVFTVQLDVKPECVHVFEESLLNVINRMSAEDAFVSCYLDKDPNEDSKYILYEIWKESSVEAFLKNQSNKDYRFEFNSKIDGWIKKDKVVTILEPVQDWHK
jgi:quinol monooxygenase YgiN